MRSRVVVVAVGLLALCAGASAQYRSVDPNGRVVYSDQPPASGAVRRIETTGSRATVPAQAGAAAGRSADLPFATRKAAERAPVTVYVTEGCIPCDQLRAHLQGRGVPFATRTVDSAADQRAFSELGFTALQFPAMTIGTRRITGFEAGGLDAALDGAGYPQAGSAASSAAAMASRRGAPSAPIAALAPQDGAAPAAADAGREITPAQPPLRVPDAPAPGSIRF